MSESLVVKRKDLKEALDMLEDALSMLEEPEPFMSSEDIKSILEYVYSKLRELLRPQKKGVNK
jgi:SpoVK/Ycf46/Vps4 family AAA+-type ATPase